MGALDGIKVVDVGVLVQAPQAAMMLGNLGADVIKVELPGFGDQARWLPVGDGVSASPYFEGCNRGKRGATIDLRKPVGKEIFAGALSYLMFTSFGTSIDNSIENVEFVNAKPVHFPEMVLEWGSDSGGGGWRTAGFTDIDGSLGFGPNAYIVNDIGILSGVEACEAQPTWNAVVCEGDVGRMNVGSGGGGFGGRGGRGGGAPAEPPVVLSRNGVEFTATGQTSVVAGTEITVVTEREELSIGLSQLDTGSWVIFELPGFTTPASGTEQSSLDAMRAASNTSYYVDDDALWVKVVVADNGGGGGGRGRGGFGGGTSVQVSR